MTGLPFSVNVAARSTRSRTFQTVTLPPMWREKGGQASRRRTKGNPFFKKMNEKYSIEAVILAGGLSRRMGKEKAQLRLGRRTLLGHARALAADLGLPCRVLRVDRLPGLGPLGGIETALRRAKAGRVLFLSCDMPFLQPGLVEQLLAMNTSAAFTAARAKVGFPFCLSREILLKVEAQLAAGQLSLQAFARKIRARRLRVPKADWPQLDNLNTPAELAAARARLH